MKHTQLHQITMLELAAAHDAQRPKPAERPTPADVKKTETTMCLQVLLSYEAGHGTLALSESGSETLNPRLIDQALNPPKALNTELLHFNLRALNLAPQIWTPSSP